MPLSFTRDVPFTRIYFSTYKNVYVHVCISCMYDITVVLLEDIYFFKLDLDPVLHLFSDK